MIYKNFGKTQTAISAIGQGTIGAGSISCTSPEKIRKRIEVILSGIEEGITFLDTGEDYEDGHAEVILGKAIKGLRDKILISSKFQPAHNSFPGVLKAAEMSLQRLGTDYIDLYQMQWPNPKISFSETMDAMLKLVEQGKVKFLGVSNITLPFLKEIVNLYGEKVVAVQTEYNLFNRDIEKEILPYCKNNNILLIAYSPLSRWNLTLKDHEKRIIGRLCEKYNSTNAQIILNWIISHDNVVALTQTMNSDHLRENARATDFCLDQNDIEEINRTFRREPVLIPVDRISVINCDADETHRIYITLEEALSNKMNFSPSPLEIAQELKEGSMLKPVELVLAEGYEGYYDLIHGRMRYWAWIIAFGKESAIPAYVINDVT